MERGYNIIIALGSTPIAGTKSNEMETECELIEVSSPISGQWRNFIAGRKDWGFTVGWLLSGVSNVTELLKVGNSYTIYVRKTGTTTSYLTGTAICKKCKITASIGNMAQGSFSFQGTGALAAP